MITQSFLPHNENNVPTRISPKLLSILQRPVLKMYKSEFDIRDVLKIKLTGWIFVTICQFRLLKKNCRSELSTMYIFCSTSFHFKFKNCKNRKFEMLNSAASQLLAFLKCKVSNLSNKINDLRRNDFKWSHLPQVWNIILTICTRRFLHVSGAP